MITKNLNEHLVNGIRGTITNLNEDSVDVKFEIKDKMHTVNIVPATFTTYDPVDKIVLATRIQLPIKVAYAFTIHKSQGMTLKNVIVTCQSCFQPGQLGVAVGRAVSVAGLKIVNFKKSLCRKHSNSVNQFYTDFTPGELKFDLSCCRNKNEIDNRIQENSDTDTGSEIENTDNSAHDVKFIDEDSDFSDSEIDKLEYLENIVDNSGCRVFQLQSLTALENVSLEFMDTPFEKQITDFKQSIISNYKCFDDWFAKQSSLIDDIGLLCFPEEEKNFSQKHRNEFFLSNSIST